jgi:ATP-dependent Lhr-like helicase
MKSSQSVLTQFHPLVARWFKERVGQPTVVQEQAWPKIAAREHLLITAPTGTGKTLAAFLWALNQMIIGQWPTGQTSVLYVSPLRALNYDIQRNLLLPLNELKQIFREAEEDFPDIRVLTRSGDTPQSDRRRMLRHPPEILITTPESLNLLLSSQGGRSILTNISIAILDEIHAVHDTKRGVYLMTAVDRLVRLSGEFQRVALSATIQPLEKIAEFVAGFRLAGEPGDPRYIPRPVSIVSSRARKQYDIRLRYVREAGGQEESGSLWEPLVQELKKIIAKNRSTLVFVNSRRLCEMLTLMINQNEEEPLAYAHHGSLSLEIRSEVERRLKAGVLRAIVATHSLELGIDIGSLDEVVLVQSPFSISSAIQRVGRSGHQVNQVSRGILFPTHPKDLLEAAVLGPAILNHDIESSRTILSPLDVLAQVIVSMVGVETWDIDALFANLKATYSYRHLSREQFDLVLNMLAGRYAESRIRELKPLVSIDHLDHTVGARRGALQILYLSGGVIPDRGYFHLRHQETHARIGELDEEFVWEASVGDTFSLGAQNWQIHRITHNDVFVLPGNPKTAAAPFWKAEENDRDFHFSERVGQFLEEAEGRLEDPDFAESLQRRNGMEPGAAVELIDFLKKQKEATGCPLPHRHHLVVEFVAAGPGGTPQAVLHTMWGGRVNRPLAMTLDAAWQARFGYRLELYVSNDCVVFQLPHEIAGEELLSLVENARVESLLRARLEGSGFFGARFRECAGRALLLPRSKFNERIPLWLSRLKSQKLLEAVLNYEDFPILLETWRTCMQDEFDLESLKRVLEELESGSISWTAVHTALPSPFARSDGWRQVNQYMYMDDQPRSDKISKLRGSLLREVVLTPGLRPAVSRKLIEQFELKRKRLSPGYSPQTSRELVDWVMERVAIPKREWEELLEEMRRDHGTDPKSFTDLEDKLIQFYPPELREPLIVAKEMLPRMISTLYGPEKDESVHVQTLTGVPLPEEEYKVSKEETEDGEGLNDLIAQWLQFYGPVTVEFIHETLGIESERLQLILGDLTDSQKVVQGQLVTEGGPNEVCDSENFEMLLRLVRIEAAPTFEPLGIEWLPLFLADYQGMTRPPDRIDGIDGLSRCMEQLVCHSAEARTWESEIFPARLHPYDPSWLDTLMQEGGLLWIGSEGRRVTFCFESELDLVQEGSGEAEFTSDDEHPARLVSQPGAALPVDLFPDAVGRYDFSALLRLSKSESAELAKRLWDEVWKGKATNDTFISLRRALMNRFRMPERVSENSRKLGRRESRFRRLSLAERKEGPFYPGNWHPVPRPELPEDLLEREELRKDRARLLLDRYGILFRELLQREWPALRWSNVFRALRIMELSGEVRTGIFFHGIPGPQFISHRAFRRLQRKLPEDVIYWINATDPASLCGIQLDSVRGMLPARVATTHLVYRGNRLIVVSNRNGKDLLFNVAPDDPSLPEYMVVLRHLLTRKFQPVKRVSIETINGERAIDSPYIPALRTFSDVAVDYKNVTLYRKIR